MVIRLPASNDNNLLGLFSKVARYRRGVTSIWHDGWAGASPPEGTEEP